MQTHSIEAANATIPLLLDLAAKGEEVLLTKNHKPLAKLVPIDDDETYRRDVRALRGFVKGMNTDIEREDEDRV